MKQIAIYGGGGFAREVAWLIESCNDSEDLYKVVCFIDDDVNLQGTIVNQIPILSLDNAKRQFSDAFVVGGIGPPALRQKVMKKALDVGFKNISIVHPQTQLSRFVEIGLGTIVCAGNILTTNIQLGRHVQINLDCTIGHDVIMGDYTTLAPGVHVSGWVHFGKRVYVGTGAVIINGTKENPIQINDDVIIGAGACVVGSVPSGTTVVGVPAKPIRK